MYVGFHPHETYFTSSSLIRCDIIKNIISWNLHWDWPNDFAAYNTQCDTQWSDTVWWWLPLEFNALQLVQGIRVVLACLRRHQAGVSSDAPACSLSYSTSDLAILQSLNKLALKETRATLYSLPCSLFRMETTQPSYFSVSVFLLRKLYWSRSVESLHVSS